MNSLILCVVAIFAGVAIAAQASINAMMGTVVKSPLLSLTVAFFVSGVFAATATALFSPNLADINRQSVPAYFWLFSGLLSCFGVGAMYFLIPRLGIGNLMSLALSGQVLGAIIIGHFAWFGSAPNPLTLQRVLGVIMLIGGICLINLKMVKPL